MTAVHADALAVFLCTLRPDWSKRYVVDALGKAQAISTDVERVTRVAVRAALTATIIKPDVIAMTGTHWKAQADQIPEPPTYAAQTCGSCHGRHPFSSPCDPAEVADAGPYIAQLRLIHGTTKPPPPPPRDPEPA